MPRSTRLRASNLGARTFLALLIGASCSDGSDDGDTSGATAPSTTLGSAGSTEPTSGETTQATITSGGESTSPTSDGSTSDGSTPSSATTANRASVTRPDGRVVERC